MTRGKVTVGDNIIGEYNGKGVLSVLKKTANRKIWNEFSDYLKYEKKMKLNTTLSYERDLKKFFCKNVGNSCPPQNLFYYFISRRSIKNNCLSVGKKICYLF